MDYNKIFILEELKKELSLKERILLYFLKKYTYRIYIKGVKKGFDWDY